MSHDYSEDILIQESIGHLLERRLGWEAVYAYNTSSWAKTARRNFQNIRVRQAYDHLLSKLMSGEIEVNML